MTLLLRYHVYLSVFLLNGSNVSLGGPGGHITAALYLQSFLRNAPGSTGSSGKGDDVGDLSPPVQTPWVHVDMMGFNRAARPGRPVGGEAQGMRAVYAWLKERYPPK